MPPTVLVVGKGAATGFPTAGLIAQNKHRSMQRFIECKEGQATLEDSAPLAVSAAIPETPSNPRCCRRLHRLLLLDKERQPLCSS